MFLFKVERDKRRERGLRFVERPGRVRSCVRCFTHAISSNPDSNASRQQPSREMREMAESHAAGVWSCWGLSRGLLNSKSLLGPFLYAACRGTRPASTLPVPSTSMQGLLHPCVQDSVIGQSITSFPLSQNFNLSLQTRSLTIHSHLARVLKKRIILTTVKSISMTTPETSKNQLPSKAVSLMKGQRLVGTTGGVFKMVT